MHTFSIINSFFSLSRFSWFSMDTNGSIICRNQIMNKSKVFHKCENIRTQHLRWNDEDDRHCCDGCGQSQTNWAVAVLNGIQNSHNTTTNWSEKKNRSHTLSPICLFFISHSYISIVLIYDARFACAHPMADAKWNRWRSVAHGVRILWCRTQRLSDKPTKVEQQTVHPFRGVCQICTVWILLQYAMVGTDESVQRYLFVALLIHFMVSLNESLDWLSLSLSPTRTLFLSRFFPLLSHCVVRQYVDGRGQKTKVQSDGPEQIIIAVSCWCMFIQRQIRKCVVAQTHILTLTYSRTNVQWSMFDKYMVLMTRQIMRFSTRIFDFFVRSIHDERHLRKPLCECRCRLSTNACLHFIDRWLTPEHTVALRNYPMCCDAAKQLASAIPINQ